MNLIMPMGGAGSRFSQKYNKPKPLIEIKGKPFLYWATNSVLKYYPVKNLVFVVLQEHIDNFEIDKVIEKYYGKYDYKLVILPKMLNGPVYTTLEAIKVIDNDDLILFNDVDHIFYSLELKNFIKNYKNDDNFGGALLNFYADSPAYSYVKIKDKRVLYTVEKEVVSNKAICGAYLFKNKDIFSKHAKAYLSNISDNEAFMSQIYNYVINNNIDVKSFMVDFNISFGTIDEFSETYESDIFDLFKM